MKLSKATIRNLATRPRIYPRLIHVTISISLLALTSDKDSSGKFAQQGGAVFTAGFSPLSIFGFATAAGERDPAADYPSLEKIEERFRRLVAAYPHLAAMYQIGESAVQRRPIWAIRVSDNPEIDEDEPAVLFNGVQHAREPMGAFICAELLEELAENYDANPAYRRFVDELEIWLVPIVNPDGYNFIVENHLRFPWWRKNLRDNNGDGIFNPLIDGVDLNRNYGYNWGDGDESAPGSWFFHGSAPFSEPEISGLRDLARRENIVIGVDYHSYGESVLFPWGNFHPAPDHALIYNIAENCARHIGRESGHGQYSILPLNARVGQSSIWMYGELGAMHYIIETAAHYFPSFDRVPEIAQENLRGAEFLMERALSAGITGHVRDMETGKPLVAEILVDGLVAQHVRPRQSDEFFGRFDRLLLPGSYKVTIVANNYEPVVFDGLRVLENNPTLLEVSLRRREIATSGAN